MEGEILTWTCPRWTAGSESACVIEPRSNLKQLFRYPILQEGRYGKLRLDKNENTLGFPPEIIADLLSGISPDFLAAYPEPFSLYRRIAAKNQLEPESILLTAGSEMAIRYLLETYLSPEDEIVIANPSFAMFDVYSRLIGARIQAVDYDRNFYLSEDSIIDRIGRNTKVIAIANPNNPTGTVLSSDRLVKVLNAAKDRAIVLLDEAYYYFCTETMLPRLSEFPNLVITRTFSKACGIAGVRLGYAVGAPDVISQIVKLQPIDHVSNFAVKVGEYIIDHEDLIWEYVREVQKGKDYLLSELGALGLRCRGSQANFVLVDFGNRQQEVVRQLKNRDILVGANLRLPFPSGYTRVTVGPIHQMTRFVDALRDILSVHSQVASYLYGGAITT
jgi:histidinol-phosphate aminotransferase